MPGRNKQHWMTPVSRMASQAAGMAPLLPNAPIPGITNGNPPVAATIAAPMMQTAHAQSGGVDPLSQTLMTLSINPYIVGFFMLFLNLGGRFLSLELTKKQEDFLKSSWIRPLIFFAVTYIATRNLAAAFWITLVLFFVLWVVANEHSPFCMIPSWHAEHAAASKKQHDTYEQNIAHMHATAPAPAPAL